MGPQEIEKFSHSQGQHPADKEKNVKRFLPTLHLREG